MLYCGARDKTNKQLQNLLQRGGISPVEITLIKKIRDEMLHTDLVRKAMKEVTGKDSIHGWSKDYFYMAVTSLGCEERLINILVKVKEEHYECEGYNIEHKDYCGHLLSDEQILEMTIDRLGRHIEIMYNWYDYDIMFQLEPKFRQCPVMGCMLMFGEDKCQHEEDLVRKLQSNVSKYKDVVFNVWNINI